MKALTGRESSVLALLAQCRRHLTSSDHKRILGTLKGDALDIGQAILGKHPELTKSIKAAAKGFNDWADGLGQHESP